MRQMTLNFFLSENRVLLAMKKRGFGVGKWNGYGGKCQEGETVEQSAVREIQEESGITITTTQLTHRGSLEFYFSSKPEWNQEVQIYIINEWKGEPIETEEMKPQWFSFVDIPYDLMWKDDQHWLPLVLNGARISGQFTFGYNNEDIEQWDVRTI